MQKNSLKLLLSIGLTCFVANAHAIGNQPISTETNEGGPGTVSVLIDNNHRIVKIDPEGVVLSETPLDFLEKGDEVKSIAVDAEGNISILIDNSHRTVDFVVEQ